MPDANQPPSARAQVGGTIQRANRLERKTKPIPQPAHEPIVFSYPGTIVIDTESGPWYAETPTLITQVRVSLTTAAGSDNTIEIRVDGSAIQQFTLTAGLVTSVHSCNIVVVPGVPLTVKTIAVSGTDLVVSCRKQNR